MSENFYHKNLKRELRLIAEESGKYKTIWLEKKLPLAHPNLELVFHYKPDAVLITKSGKKYIFEILDDQINDYNLIVSDIIQCLLTENIAKVIFISKDDCGAKLTKKLFSVLRV